MNICNIKRTFVQLRPVRKWDTIYWLVDAHGVIIPGSWHNKNDFQFISRHAKEVLQWISNREDQRLILWTSSYPKELDKLVCWLASEGIRVNHINENPEEKNTEYADFSKKPYFNILVDDKSGFEPEWDWAKIIDELKEIGEW